MAKNKLGLQFSGFEEMIANLEKAKGDIKGTTEKALIESQKIIAEESHTSMGRHHDSGETEGSIIEDGKVEWQGLTASIGVGFDIGNGGFPSIFLMYGTPRMNKDTKVYNAVYGKKVRDAISKVQKDIFDKAIFERIG